MAGSGTGNIVGTYWAYVRFIDRDGNISSLSPISDKFLAETSSQTITGATNASPIVISGPSGLADGQIVKITGITGNTGANGTWIVQSDGSGGYELWIDDATASVGTGTYQQGGTLTTGFLKVTYLNVGVSTESKVVRRQVLRNADGDANTFYVDIDTTDVTSTTLESSSTSFDLIFKEAVPLTDATGHTLVDKPIPPDYKKIAMYFGGRMFAAGVEPYSEGAAAVVQGSQAVTGIGTSWGRITFPGRYIEFVGNAKQYTIQDVQSATSLTLTEPYTGTTDPFALYVIHPGIAERRTLYWSEPQQSEAWPRVNKITLEADPGAGDITGLMPHRSWVYILAENRIYRLSFVNDPLVDGFTNKAAKRGCVNNRCWQLIDDMAYVLDYQGFHVFAGNDDSDISMPAVQDMFRTNPNGPWKINWEAKRYFHSCYEPGTATIRWFVALGGHYTPHHAVCYNVRLKRWWVEEFPFPVASSILGRLYGQPQLFFGSSGKRILAFGTSPMDGTTPDAGTLRGTVSSSGPDWFADSSATFPNVVGYPVFIVRGTGKGQRRIVCTRTATRLDVTVPWTIKPDTTSVYQIGGIAWSWRGGWMRWADDKYQDTRAVSIQSRPTTNAAEMYLRVYADLAETPAGFIQIPDLNTGNGIGSLQNDATTDLTIDTTKSSGYVVARMDGFRDWYTDENRMVALQLAGVTNDERCEVFRVLTEGAQ